jgi:hypothetical protein
MKQKVHPKHWQHLPPHTVHKNRQSYNTDVNPDVGKQPWKCDLYVSWLGAFKPLRKDRLYKCVPVDVGTHSRTAKPFHKVRFLCGIFKISMFLVPSSNET